VTYIDDADIDIAVADCPLTQPELEALSNARSFMERGGFTSERQSRSFAIELLAGGAVAVLVIGLILALLRPLPARPLPAGSRPTASPTTTPEPSTSPTQTTVPLDIIAQLNVGSQYVNAMAVGPDAVWLAIQGVNYGDAGTLIRVNPKTARKTASWTIGGDPAAVAVAGGFVWVTFCLRASGVYGTEHCIGHRGERRDLCGAHDRGGRTRDCDHPIRLRAGHGV
jgi:hypothetical protein